LEESKIPVGIAAGTPFRNLVGIPHAAAHTIATVNPRVYPGLLPLVKNGGTSAGLDGVSGSRITMSGPTIVLGTTFSLEGWFAGSYINNTSLLGSWDGNGMMLYLASETILRFYTSASNVSATVPSVIDGLPKHVVGTYDGTTARLYLNGVQVASGAIGKSNSGTYWECGNYTSGTGSWLAARVGHLAIYGRALSAGEVLAHYNAGKP
jgi:hypothetical protein